MSKSTIGTFELFDLFPDKESLLKEMDERVDTDCDPPHQSGCICADCSGAELTADND